MNYEPAVNEQGRDSEQWPAPGVKASGSGVASEESAAGAGSLGDDYEDDLPDAAELMAYARAAVQLSDTSDLGQRKSSMLRNWNAFNNRHNSTSRYHSSNEAYKSRSRLFPPKIRSNVIKNAVATAQALFSTNDVVEVTGSNESDPRQRASASVIKALLNYRLDRTSGRSGVPWFWIAIAAAIDAQVSGVVISKQLWEYDFVVDTFDQPGDNVAAFPSGEVAQSVQKKRVILDRPKIDLHPPENVIVDMAAPFWDVVQGGAFFIVKHAMHVDDVQTAMKPGRSHMGGGAWFNIPDKTLRGAIVDYANTAVRTARSQGNTDPIAATSTPNVNGLQIIWVHENFIRCRGRDYQFWSLGTTQLLSEPIETDEAYPAHKGNRPYTMGVGSIEPHNAIPMSPVESVMPLQDELADHRNLAVDVMRQTVAPIAKIRRGAKIDFRQMRKRGPETNILVDEPDDVTFEMPPSNLAMAAQMQDRVANEMDEVLGAFSGSSVQQNRNLNETVGGMKLLSQSAGGKSEYDVRIFAETWAEETLRQVTWLEQYYETDEKVLAVAGNRAKLFDKYKEIFQDPQPQPGMPPSPQLSDADKVHSLLDADVTLKLSVGTGASDPVERLQKFVMGLKTLAELAASGVFEGQVTAKAKEIFDEVMALTGYPEAERFFTFKTPEEAQEAQAGQPNPEQMKLDIEKSKVEGEIADKKAGRDLESRKLDIEEKKTTGTLGLKGIELKADMAAQENEHALRAHETNRDFKAGREDTQHERATDHRDFSAGRADKQHEKATGEREFAIGQHDKQHERAAGERDRQDSRQSAQEDRAQRSEEIASRERTASAKAAAKPGEGGGAPAPAPQQASPEMGQIMQALERITAAQEQQGQVLAAILAERENKQRVVRDGMNRSVPVEAR